ncbi:hypothetical protein DOY81_002511, partial [Sarcophaga bullata]
NVGFSNYSARTRCQQRTYACNTLSILNKNNKNNNNNNKTVTVTIQKQKNSYTNKNTYKISTEKEDGRRRHIQKKNIKRIVLNFYNYRLYLPPPPPQLLLPLLLLLLS